MSTFNSNLKGKKTVLSATYKYYVLVEYQRGTRFGVVPKAKVIMALITI